MRVFQMFMLLAALLAGGCVVSKSPIPGLGERALPIASGTKLNLFERANAGAPWNPGEQKSVTLVASPDRVYRAVDESGKMEDDPIVFYSLGADRFLVQAQFSAERFGYAVLQVRGGEGLVSTLACKNVDPELLRKSGLKMAADDCWLEQAGDPGTVLKQIAARAGAPLLKYEPVKKP